MPASAPPFRPKPDGDQHHHDEHIHPDLEDVPPENLPSIRVRPIGHDPAQRLIINRVRGLRALVPPDDFQVFK